MGKDLFAPPTEEELRDDDLFAPPTPEELGEEPLVSVEGLKKAAIESLPMAGGMVGGTLGLPLGPIGAMAGAGAGAYTGKALENLIEYMLGEQKTRQQVYAEPVEEAVKGAAGEGVGAIASKVVPATTKAIGTGMKKLASGMSMVPEKAIETYMKYGPEVDKLAAGSETFVIDEADRIRQQAQRSIENFKAFQNQKITSALSQSAQTPVDAMPVIRSLEDSLSKITPEIRPDEYAKIQKELEMINSLVDENGQIPAQQMQEVKQKFQDLAEYLAPGQMMKKKNFVDISFARAANRAGMQVSRVAPDIAEANSQISKIRRMDKTLNKALITPEKPSGALVAAGIGANQLARKQLENLDQILGTNLLAQAEQLAAGQYLGNPSLFPNTMTGARAIPLIGGGSFALSEAMQGNVGPAIGGLMTASFGSPLAVKYGAQAAKAAQPGVDLINQIVPQVARGAAMSPMSPLESPLQRYRNGQ